MNSDYCGAAIKQGLSVALADLEVFDDAFCVQVDDCSSAFARFEYGQVFNDLFCDSAVEPEFKKASVRTAFAWRVQTVAVVNKNYHR